MSALSVFSNLKRSITYNLKPVTSKRGFTLMELLIAISIIAIISAIGLVSYNQAQKLARDSKRKQDLRAIAVALELYYQENGRYPCPVPDGFLTSAGGGDWITDLDSNCSATPVPLDSNHINPMPKDPLNTGGSPTASGNGYTYAYRGYHSSKCSSQRGQFYILVAQLENKNDPERNAVRGIKDCNNPPTTDLTGTGWDTSYIITSGS